MRPELLAVRAINQYRSRDVLAYLALRYYLENLCARSDLWARDISTHLLSTRLSPAYFRTFHFKETEGDSVIHRSIFIPGPNEALAETALLYECSKYSSFMSSANVYSYHFSTPQSKEGVFRSYFPGYRGRHRSIANAVSSLSDSKVRYTDIKKFYPSISKELALQQWKLACDSSTISNIFRDLGEHLLTEHSSTAIACNEGVGVLTGPMFSHLIANLVLANVDKIMSESMAGNYW